MLILASPDDGEIPEDKLNLVIDDCANTYRLRPDGDWSGIQYRTRQHTDRFLDASNPDFAVAEIFRPVSQSRMPAKAGGRAARVVDPWG